MEDQQQSLNDFLKKLERFGRHRKVANLYEKETKPSDIIVGEVYSMADIVEKPNRKQLVTVLREVYPDGSKGKLFSLFAFDTYAHNLKLNSSAIGSIVGICGADVDKCPVIDNDDHDHMPYRARIGLPKKPGSKLLFIMNAQESETLPKIQRLNSSRRTSVSSQSKQNESKSSQITSKEGPNTLTTATGASKSKPERSTSQMRSKTSTVVEGIFHSVPSTSKALPDKLKMLQSKSSTSSIASSKVSPESKQLQKSTETINRYQYSKLCDLNTAAARLNVYGIINRLFRKRDDYAHLDIVDETLPADQAFKLHIFKGSAPSLPNIIDGYIIRAHRMKTEEYRGQWDGRVFDAKDIVIFPPEGIGKEGAETVSKSFHFEDADLERLTKLRQWIKEEYSRRTLSPVPTSRESSVCGLKQHNNGGYNSSVKTLAEIQSEGRYILYCKVVESRHKKGKTVLIVTDGTIPSDLITREEARSADRDQRSEDSRTVKVILKSETHMKLQDEFVKMIGVEAEMITDAYSEKTCLAFVLWKIQNIEIIPPTHSQAKLISRRLQQMKKDAKHSVAVQTSGTSKRLPNNQKVESDSNSRNGHDNFDLNDLPLNRKRRINSQTQESENRGLERNIEKTGRRAKSTNVQQRQRASSSEDFRQIRHHHSWRDPQGQFDVTSLDAEISRNNTIEIEVLGFNASTPIKNSDEPNSSEDGKDKDIISLLYNVPKEKNVPMNIQQFRSEHADYTSRSPSLLKEDKQSSSNDCEIMHNSNLLIKAPLVLSTNSNNDLELLKSLKQKPKRKVYEDSLANVDHSLECSNDTIYDNGVKTVPSQVPNEKSHSQECLECSSSDSTEMMANMDQCLSRIARVEPTTRDQEKSQVSTVLECAEEIGEVEDSEEQSSTETEQDKSQQNFDVANLHETFSACEQADNESEGEITVVRNDVVTPAASPSGYRGDLRKEMSQFQPHRNVDSGTSDDEHSGTSNACIYISQNKATLGKRVAESGSGCDVDRLSKYHKTSSGNGVCDVQNINSSDEQESVMSENSSSVTSCWTEVEDTADENSMPVTIRCIKSRGIEENEYMVEGIITQIEPPIRDGYSSKDFVSGYCAACNTFSRYSTLILEGNSQEGTCPRCPEGRRKPVTLMFALKFHIVDKTNEKLVLGLCGESGVNFFGVTANRYLRDPQIRRQVIDALLDMLPANKGKTEPRKIKFYIQSFLDFNGMQYMIKKTYLCFSNL